MKVRKLSWKALKHGVHAKWIEAYCGEIGPISSILLSQDRWYILNGLILSPGENTCGSHKTEALAKAKVQKLFDQLVKAACIG